MSDQRSNGWVQIIAAIASCATTVGMAIVIVITAWHGKTIEKQGVVLTQVEKQGNSLRLEQQRVTAAALRAAAAATKLPEDELKARDAETLYLEAKKQAEQNSK